MTKQELIDLQAQALEKAKDADKLYCKICRMLECLNMMEIEEAGDELAEIVEIKALETRVCVVSELV